VVSRPPGAPPRGSPPATGRGWGVTDGPLRPRGLLLDLDGTVYEDDTPVPGAPEAIAALREAGIAVRFVTNTTRAPRTAIAGWLEGFGVPAGADDVFTPPRAAHAWLLEQGMRRVALALPEETFPEFAGLDLVEDDPQAVVVGDLGTGWTFETMNRVFAWVHGGAALVALHRNRYWKTGGRLVLDAGAFVAAFEYATGVSATLVGKPSRALFESAAHSMSLEMDDVLMVGDDLRADVAGAQALGIPAVLVRTGKFRPADLEGSGLRPDAVVDSLAALPALVAG
jgi:HAD superfamily hydrolase (TIGR01458 family)